MPGTFAKYLISLNSFGEPISVNYNGDTTFKTCIGAFSTIVLKSFLLIYAVVQLIALFTYEDPEISQYVIYEPRTDGETLNMQENLASIGFTLSNFASID